MLPGDDPPNQADLTNTSQQSCEDGKKAPISNRKHWAMKQTPFTNRHPNAGTNQAWLARLRQDIPWWKVTSLAPGS
jgi:hypothetical protein